MNDISEQKQCPFCKSMIDKRASVCPNCRKDLSVAGNLGKLFWSIGVFVVLAVILVPVIMFACGGCSI